MSQGYQRMLPVLDDLNTPFWTGGKDGVLLVQRCQNCHAWLHPPLPICPRCHSKDIAPEQVSGNGEVYSFTVNCKAWGPGLEIPYVIAIISFPKAEGLQITTNLLAVKPEDVQIGMPVELCFENDEDVWLPMARPLSGPACD